VDGETVSGGDPASGGLREARDVGVVSDSSQLDGRRVTLGVRRRTDVDAISTDLQVVVQHVASGEELMLCYPLPVWSVERHQGLN